MKINVMMITGQGMERTFSTEDWVKEAIEEAIDGTVTEFQICFQMERVNQRVSVGVRFSFSAVCVCMRCASPMTIQFSDDEDLVYDPIEETMKTAEHTHHVPYNFST